MLISIFLAIIFELVSFINRDLYESTAYYRLVSVKLLNVILLSLFKSSSFNTILGIKVDFFCFLSMVKGILILTVIPF